MRAPLSRRCNWLDFIRLSSGITGLIGPNGSGKCVTPDTIVYLADGKRITIEELVETQFQKQIIQPFKDGGMVLGEGTHVLSIDLQKSEVVSKPIFRKYNISWC